MATKTWLRWTQKTKEFPKPKYNFTSILTHVGDSIETYPMSYEDYIRFKDAAKFWAWHHGKRIKIKSIRQPNRMRVAIVMLISHSRTRNLEWDNYWDDKL